MKNFLSIVLFASVVLSANQIHAQVEEPINPNNGGGSTTETRCPERLEVIFGELHFYQLINCQTGLMLPEVTAYPSAVPTGCANTTTCNCDTQSTTLSKYADPKARLFVPFGGGVTTHRSTEAIETVKAGGKVFRTVSIRIKGKKTTGADSELECIVLFGAEVDPGTPTAKSGTLTGNKLTYDGREFTVFTKAPAAANAPQ